MKKNVQSFIGMTMMFALLYAIADSASQSPPLAATAGRSYGASRVGFVDIPTIMKNADFVQELREKIQAELDAKLEHYETKLREYTKLLDEIKRQKNVLTEAALDAKYKQAFALKAQLDEEKYTVDKFLKESEKQDMVPAQDRILEVVHEVARAEGFDIVLRRELLIYGYPSVDLSGKVIARLNAAPQQALPPNE